MVCLFAAWFVSLSMHFRVGDNCTAGMAMAVPVFEGEKK